MTIDIPGARRLQLLAEKPRHGYEIIKELEERSGGAAREIEEIGKQS